MTKKQEYDYLYPLMTGDHDKAAQLERLVLLAHGFGLVHVLVEHSGQVKQQS